MYGFSEKQLKEIIQIFSSYKEIDEAILFGSRAKETHKEASDVDIAIKGKNITYSFAAKLKSHLEDDTNLPYFFDIIAYKTITSKELKEHIRIYGKTIISGSKNIPEDWVETTLGEVAVIKGGKRLPKGKSLVINKTKHPYIRITDFNGNAINKNNLQFIPDETFNKIAMYIVNEKDVIISIVGTIGLVAIIDNDLNNASLTENCVKLINLKNVDNYYIYYYLTSGIGQDEINKNTVGAVQKKLPIYGVQNIKVSLPQLTEQKQIAKILTSFDDKIDLLQAQNKTLENMAQTLFRQWFVEQADAEWEVGKIPDEFDFIMGQSPPGKSYNEEQNGIPMFQGNADFGFRFPANRIYTTQPKRFAEKYDTLISVRAPVGEQNMAKEKCCIGRGVATFRYKNDNSFYTYTYFKIMSLIKEIQQYNQTGTVFGSISKSDFQNMEIIIPPIELIKKFQTTAKPIDDKIIANETQINTLENLRDTLLPKLMSGKIRIKC